MVRAGDAEQLARLAVDPALRERLGAAAQARVWEYALPHALSTWTEVAGLSPQPAASRRSFSPTQRNV